MTSFLYPKNKEELLKKYQYFVENEQSPREIDKLEEWLKWFHKVEKFLTYNCKENEFFKWYVENNNYSLQIWKHNENTNIDELLANIASNYYDIYNTSETLIIK